MELASLTTRDWEILTSLTNTEVHVIYEANVLRDTLRLFVIEHDDDLSSYAVASNISEQDVLYHIHDVKEAEFAVSLFPTFREAVNFYNERVDL